MSGEPARLAVTVLAPTLDPAGPVWGSERSILTMAPELRSRGVDLTLATLPDGQFARAARALDLRVVPFELDDPGPPPRNRLQLLGREVRATPRNTARIVRASAGSDVVHCNTLVLHPAAALAGRIRRRPVVLEQHDIVTPGAAALMLSAAAAASAAVVSISRATSASIRGPGAAKVHLVPQAIDLARFTPGPGDPALRAAAGGVAHLIGIVGRVDPAKGVDTLVRAVAAAGPDIGLLVVGAPSLDAGYLHEIRALAADLLGERFHYAGTVEDVPHVLRSLDVLVNASDAEPFGLTILEAQACGVPVIGTAAGGVPDFVEDGRTGLLVAPRDVPALTAALRRIVDDRQLADRLSTDALSTVRERYGIAGRAAALADLYRSVARLGRPRERG